MMKKYLLCLFLICSLSTCTGDDELEPDQFPQKWQLVKMTGEMVNSESTGDDMDWQEYYILKSDDTFTKFREREGLLSEASGTFEFVNTLEVKYLELSYPRENELIGNCVQEPRERLVLESDDILLGTWSACDGPGLEYKRVKLK
jgi:hypothetical protein